VEFFAVIYWSIVAALVGTLGTWFGMARLDWPKSSRPPELFWVLGMAAVFPSWLVAVLALLGRMTGRFPEVSLAGWWIMSGAALILGVILTDAKVRRLRESGKEYPRARYWVLGVVAFLPAWWIALLGLLWTSRS
jgi:hypothetical protein